MHRAHVRREFNVWKSNEKEDSKYDQEQFDLLKEIANSIIESNAEDFVRDYFKVKDKTGDESPDSSEYTIEEYIYGIRHGTVSFYIDDCQQYMHLSMEDGGSKHYSKS